MQYGGEGGEEKSSQVRKLLALFYSRSLIRL